LRSALAIERSFGAHFDNMAAYWQDCEVAKPNKLVPVPRKNAFSSFRKTKQICLKTVTSSNESTSSGSGSHRSQEEGTEKHLLRQNIAMRGAAKDKPDGGDCGSYLDANIEIEEIATAFTCAIAVVV